MKGMRAALALLAALAISPAVRSGTAPEHGPVVYAAIPAHPALWTVHGPKGIAYLFGSIHILPPQVDWHTPEIDSAIAKSDAFVFEVVLDAGAMKDIRNYVRERGMLPPGQNLRDMLSPAARGNYDRRIAQLSVAPETIGRMRPWLAGLTIGVLDITSRNYSTQSGVDLELQTGTRMDGKPVIGLETPEQQLALLASEDPKAELQAFEAGLAGAGHPADDEIGPAILYLTDLPLYIGGMNLLGETGGIAYHASPIGWCENAQAMDSLRRCCGCHQQSGLGHRHLQILGWQQLYLSLRV
jgi:hypothetical protein